MSDCKPKPDDALTVPEVARLLGISEWSARYRINRKELPAFKVGSRGGYGDWRVERRHVDAYKRGESFNVPASSASEYEAGGDS